MIACECSSLPKLELLAASRAKSIARRVRLAALWAAVDGLWGQYHPGMRLSWSANVDRKASTFKRQVLLKCVKLRPKIIPNQPQYHAKILNFGAKGTPRSTNLVPRSSLKMISEACRQKGERGKQNCAAFWRHLGDFGRLLGISWAPRGSQNRAFWYQDAPK